MNIRHVAGCPCLPGRLVVPGKSSTSIKDRGGLIVSMKSEYPSVQPPSKAAPMLMKKMLQCMFCKQLIKKKTKKLLNSRIQIISKFYNKTPEFLYSLGGQHTHSSSSDSVLSIVSVFTQTPSRSQSSVTPQGRLNK